MSQKYKYPESESCPIHLESKGIRVFTNSSGEVFVENMTSGVEMRLCITGGGLTFTANAEVAPIITNGMIGWMIGRRK